MVDTDLCIFLSVEKCKWYGITPSQCKHQIGSSPLGHLCGNQGDETWQKWVICSRISFVSKEWVSRIGFLMFRKNFQGSGKGKEKPERVV